MARPTAAERVLIDRRRARVLAMRIEQRPYSEIAAELGITEDVAEKDYQRARDAAKAEFAAARSAAVAVEAVRLDAMEQAAWEVLRRDHIVIQHGQVVRINRKPVKDDGPILDAIDRLVRISARRAKMLGLDAPVKVEVSDERRAAIRAVAERLAAARLGDVQPGGAGPAAGDAQG
jgi:hypothetical protein